MKFDICDVVRSYVSMVKQGKYLRVESDLPLLSQVCKRNMI